MRGCFKTKTFIALAGAGIAIFVIVPGAGRAVGPLLLVAACPLSMLVMMRAMGSAGRDNADALVPPKGQTESTPPSRSDDLASLRARIAELEAHASAPSPPDR